MQSGTRKFTHGLVACVLTLCSTVAAAEGAATYQVTITNLTHSINFTPILVASHRGRLNLFELGTPSSDDLAYIAESGDLGPMSSSLNANPQVKDVQNSGGLLGPGQSVSVIVSASRGARHISLASMMLPTNDGFIALNGIAAPKKGSRTFYSPAYDAGTEMNDELCANIPGPTCGGAGLSPGAVSPGSFNPGDEGYVHIHRGIHGIGNLAADTYDWRNPVAKITVTRVKHD